MSKNSSAKYHLNNKERLQKKSQERYQSFSKEKKEKSNMIANDTKMYQKMKNKSLLSIVIITFSNNTFLHFIVSIRKYYLKR